MRAIRFLLAFAPLLLLDPSGSLAVEDAPRLGEAIDAVFARLGPPKQGSGDSELQSWSWADATGHRVRAFVHAGIVIRVTPESDFDVRQLKARPVPEIGPYPGQPVAELVRALGNPGRPTLPRQHEHGNKGPSPGSLPSNGVFLVYGEQYVQVAAGRVLSAFVPTKPAGPR